MSIIGVESGLIQSALPDLVLGSCFEITSAGEKLDVLLFANLSAGTNATAAAKRDKDVDAVAATP